MSKIDLLKVCADAENIGISGHIRPDGDCVGSTMGLYLYLKNAYPKKNIRVFLESIQDCLECIKDTDKICHDISEDDEFDVFFALDCGKDRLGFAESGFDRAKVRVNIDHHISNADGSGDLNCVEPDVSSASELVYSLMEDRFVDVETAKAIYIGMINDTGIFQYSNTKPETLMAASKLIGYGFDFSELIDKTFYEKTYVQNQVMGRAMLESFRVMDGKIVVSCVSRKIMDFYGVTSKELDGIVNQLRIIRGVEVAIFMYETDTLEYKVSMRSNGKVNVSEVAQFFGGGGHVRAAGCTMNGTFYDVVNNLTDKIAKQL